MKKKNLPKQIYVKWEGEKPEMFLSAQETSRGFDDGERVGVYQLVEVKTQRVTEELV